MYLQLISPACTLFEVTVASTPPSAAVSTAMIGIPDFLAC
jgi:hypothetical protein